LAESGQQYRGTGGVPGFQIAVCLGGFGQRVGLTDFDPDRAAGNDLEQFRGAGRQIGGLGSIGHQCRPSQEQGTLGGQQARIEGLHRPGRIAETDHHPQWPQAVQRPHKGGLPN